MTDEHDRVGLRKRAHRAVSEYGVPPANWSAPGEFDRACEIIAMKVLDSVDNGWAKVDGEWHQLVKHDVVDGEGDHYFTIE